MRKFFQVLAASLALLIPHQAAPADASIVKTTVTVSTPAHLFAAVANPVDVIVCSKASLSATRCESVSERKVTLFANGQRVQTLTTIGGIATFNWKPRSSGKATLRATVAAIGSSLRAASSETKRLTIKGKTKPTSIGTMSCGTVCVSGIPAKINLSNNGAITAGITSGVNNNRVIRFQTLRVTNKFADQTNARTAWQSDLGKFGMSLSFESIDEAGDCSPGETKTWNFRFYVDATSKSPAAATKAKWIDLVCPAGDDQTGEVELNVEYYDQVLDYLSESPEAAQVSVTAPDNAQYSIGSEYCRKSSDCDDFLNWTPMTWYSKADEIFGSQEFELSMDPGEFGDYWVKVTVIPWTDQDSFESDWFSLTLE
jgi:hypothetical protein